MDLWNDDRIYGCYSCNVMYEIKEKVLSISIKENDIILGLWYDVLIKEDGKLIHCVCPYDKCKSYQDAIAYHMTHYNKINREIICVQHHGYTEETLKCLTMAA